MEGKAEGTPEFKEANDLLKKAKREAQEKEVEVAQREEEL